ncbi:ABC transporter substrate-binding protein [Bradyrhizobium guangxiense]|uniref:ABC transporter substrate-binding protein n=1 Tax=Bradyrhizobium guangxiense TaxID=1325115 RepID=UPI0010091FB3|nr:ABC transporter substrate-binding protein [Bradyrhizobium guangxiense]
MFDRKRREFITLLGSTAAWPLAARAQQPVKVPRIGFVYSGPKAAMAPRVGSILTGLQASGYAAAAQVEIVARFAEGDPDQVAPLVKEVIGKNVNVIIAAAPLVVHAARSATRTIPIVAIDLESDPVASGMVATLARPGGNITGVFLDFPDFTAKWLEMLVECNPKLLRAAVLWDPATGPVQIEAVEKAGGMLNVQLDITEVRRPSDFDAAFSRASQHGSGAMVMLSSPLIADNLPMLAELALRHRFPAITLFSDFARAGGLLAYGPNLLSLLRLSGVVAGKVLRGANPAELPIERPTKFETVINMRTALALGLSIPTSLLLRVDEVIE